MVLLQRLRKKQPQATWDVVTWPWGGWNYPDPIMADEDWSHSNYPPDDPYLKHLAYMAGHGWHYYQKAFVEMQFIHPLANYKPVIHDEFRETFDAQYEKRGMPLLIYERDGKLTMSNDWEAYWLYREREEPSIPCIILGHFKEVPGIAVCDRPYMVEKPEHLLQPHHALTAR